MDDQPQSARALSYVGVKYPECAMITITSNLELKMSKGQNKRKEVKKKKQVKVAV
jgi:hypothetical protein